MEPSLKSASWNVKLQAEKLHYSEELHTCQVDSALLLKIQVSELGTLVGQPVFQELPLEAWFLALSAEYPSV